PLHRLPHHGCGSFPSKLSAAHRLDSSLVNPDLMPDARAPTYAQPCTDHRDEKCFLDHFLLLHESAVRLRHPAQIPFAREAVTQVLILGLGLLPNIDREGHCQAIADVRASHSAPLHIVLLLKLNLLLV